MNRPQASISEAISEPRLPRRDFIFFPLLGLLTICLLAGSTEFVARWTFPTTRSLAEDCMVSNDVSTGMRGIPNSVCKDQALDAEFTEYRFNSSGYRSDENFGPKPDGTYRIVMVGTSFATGLRVPVEKTFAVLLPEELSRRTGRNVQLYNEGIIRRLPDVIAEHFNEVLKVNPDMILWVVTRSDVQNMAMIPNLQSGPKLKVESMFQNDWRLLHTEPFGTAIIDIFDHTHSSTLFRHELYQSQSMYVKSYLMGNDSEMGYLRARQSADWQNRLRAFDLGASELALAAKSAGIPLVAVYLPRGPQAAMISMNDWSPEYDPYKLDNELRSIVVSHGGTYIDILPEFQTVPNPERGFFKVEGHPNALGHALISLFLAKQLTGGAVPALAVTDGPLQANAGQGR
jgi:hypothetical protein